MALHPAQLRTIADKIVQKIRGRSRYARRRPTFAPAVERVERYGQNYRGYPHPAGKQTNAPPAQRPWAINRVELDDEEASTMPAPETAGFAAMITSMATRLKQRYDQTRAQVIAGHMHPLDAEIRHGQKVNAEHEETNAERLDRQMRRSPEPEEYEEEEYHPDPADVVQHLSRRESAAREARQRVEQYRKEGKAARFEHEFPRVLAERGIA